MRYLHGSGVFIPYAQKYKKIIIVAVAAILVLSQATWLLGTTNAAVEHEPTEPCITTEFGNRQDPQTVTTCVVETTCDEVSVTSTKDLSNIIVLYEDGTYVKYEDGVDFDDVMTWDIPQDIEDHGPITAIWIHSGNNHEDDDPQPEQYNNGESVGRYHNIDTVECDDTCTEGPGWAANVVDNEQGTTKNGGSILAARTNPDTTLGAPDATTGPDTGFYALGKNGTLTVEFDGFVTNEVGDDVSVYEITNGRNTYPEELANVHVSQDGVTWELAGQISNKDGNGTDSVDIDGTSFDWIKFVKLEDVTNFALHTNAADGYDVDAIGAANIDCEQPEEEPEVPAATLVASKIVCEDEASLPNWGTGGPDITSATFAAEWIAQHPGCELEDEWDYQYRLSGDVIEPTGYGEVAGWTTFTNDTEVALSGNTTIQVREVLPEGYIPFTGWTSQDNVSAEFYCHTDVANYDNWEWIQNPADNATYYCVAWNVPEETTFTLNATKIECDTESQLPNWGTGEFGPIGPDTATEWMAEGDNSEHCEIVPWTFQWAPDTGNPGDQTGEAGDPWSDPFGTSVVVDTNDLGESQVLWIREVFEEGYIGFGGQNTENSTSAEIYCHDDVLNFDNWEFISSPAAGADYYCVAWNVKALGSIQGLIYHDENDNGQQDETELPLENWKGWLLTHNSPYTLAADYTTGADGIFAWHDLEFGTYYVCQDLQSGWIQTELAALGDGLGSIPAGTVLGDSQEIHDWVDEFCYEVVLDAANPFSDASVFGNYQPPQTPPGNTLGASTERPDPPKEQKNGEVLAASTGGQVLAATGQPSILPQIIGVVLLLGSLLTSRFARAK